MKQKKTTVVHCKREHYDTYIGRPSIFGNPFSEKDGKDVFVIVPSRDSAIRAYRLWVEGKIVIEGRESPSRSTIKVLHGDVLGCWCSPLPCHGDVLAEIADEARKGL